MNDFDLDESVSNDAWLIHQINGADTDRLQQLAIDMDNEIFEDEPWTKDKATMDRVLTAYKQRKAFLGPKSD